MKLSTRLRRLASTPDDLRVEVFSLTELATSTERQNRANELWEMHAPESWQNGSFVIVQNTMTKTILPALPIGAKAFREPLPAFSWLLGNIRAAETTRALLQEMSSRQQAWERAFPHKVGKEATCDLRGIAWTYDPALTDPSFNTPLWFDKVRQGVRDVVNEQQRRSRNGDPNPNTYKLFEALGATRNPLRLDAKASAYDAMIEELANGRDWAYLGPKNKSLSIQMGSLKNPIEPLMELPSGVIALEAPTLADRGIASALIT